MNSACIYFRTFTYRSLSLNQCDPSSERPRGKRTTREYAIFEIIHIYRECEPRRLKLSAQLMGEEPLCSARIVNGVENRQIRHHCQRARVGCFSCFIRISPYGREGRTNIRELGVDFCAFFFY